MKRLLTLTLSLLLLCACTGAPTAAVPTEAPTEAPTAVPTATPTPVPTDAPTAEPTEVPTLAPVEKPELTALAPGDELYSAPDAGNFAMTMQDEGWGYAAAALGVNLYPLESDALNTVQIMGMNVGQPVDANMFNSLLVTVLTHLQESIGAELSILEVTDTTVNGYDARAVVSAVEGEAFSVRFYSIVWGADEQIYYASVTALDSEYDTALAMLEHALSTFCPASAMCSDAPEETEAEPEQAEPAA